MSDPEDLTDQFFARLSTRSDATEGATRDAEAREIANEIMRRCIRTRGQSIEIHDVAIVEMIAAALRRRDDALARAVAEERERIVALLDDASVWEEGYAWPELNREAFITAIRSRATPAGAEGEVA
jgi:hypothetical protein